MSDEKPPRLIDDPEFRDALAAVKREEMPPEQLQRNLRSITPTISQPPPARGIPPNGIAIGVSAVIAALAVGFVAYHVREQSRLQVATPTPQATPFGGYHPFTPSVTSSPFDLSGLAASPTSTPEPEARVPTSTPREISLAELGAETPPDATPSPATGTLVEELALFNGAVDHIRGSHYDLALKRIEELMRRFPSTTLKPEAELTRLECLLQLKRHDEARDLLTFLVDDSAHSGRRAELERIFGDVERERGDCASARVHYRASLDAGAKGDEASAVRRGIGMCEAP